MDNVALESDQLTFDSGESNINLDCTMDPEFSRGSPPSWLYQRDEQPPTQDLPWGVHSLWNDNGRALRLRIDRIGSEQAGKYTCKAGTLNRTIQVRVNKGAILLTCITLDTSTRRQYPPQNITLEPLLTLLLHFSSLSLSQHLSCPTNPPFQSANVASPYSSSVHSKETLPLI